MYRLTPRMQQAFRESLMRYHNLFSAGRCQGWELEELLYRSIQSDNAARHHPVWQEAGHDDEADIRVRTNGDIHLLQVKSGRVVSDCLELSGHRLGRFGGDFQQITDYLNGNNAEIVAVPYRKVDDVNGRSHIYQVAYADVAHLTGIDAGNWEQAGKSWRQTNQLGVRFTLHPSMSWQIWWRIPLRLVQRLPEFTIR